MFGWFGSLLGRRRPPHIQTAPEADLADSRNYPARRTIIQDDSRSIEAALLELETIGLKFKPGIKGSLSEVTEEISEQYDGIHFSGEPTPGHWAVLVLSSELQPFENAIGFDDHCYDGIQSEDFSSMVAQLIGLAGQDWPFDYVEVRNSRRVEDPLEDGQPVTVMIHAVREAAPFKLMNGKDFDWSLIHRLNERLPSGVRGRFAMFHDGHATIVFLPPEQIRQLGSFCGFQFSWDEPSES